MSRRVVKVEERIAELYQNAIDETDVLVYTWDKGYEILKVTHENGGGFEWRGVYHPDDGLCVGGGVCIYCGRTL